MLTSEYLKKAKQYIIDHGWYRGGYYWPQRELTITQVKEIKPPVCAIGALFVVEEVSGSGPVVTRSWDYLSAICRSAPATFNDCKAESVEDIYDLYDRAIALAEENEYGDDLQLPSGQVDRSRVLEVTGA